jgi:hypothetical protein
MSQNNAAFDNNNLKLIIEFNHYLSRFIHNSWIIDDPYLDIINKIKEDTNVDYQLSQYLLKKFNLLNKFYYDFNEDYKKVIFANHLTLEKLAFYIGIIFNEKIIRVNILKSQHNKLIACLGKEEYLFATRKARFLLPQENFTLDNNMIPWDNLDSFKNFLYLTGFKLLSYLFNDTSMAFKTRLLIKIDKKWRNAFNMPHDYYKLSKSKCSSLVIKIFKEVNNK